MCELIKKLLGHKVDYITWSGNAAWIVETPASTYVYIRGLNYTIGFRLDRECRPYDVKAAGLGRVEAERVIGEFMREARRVYERLSKKQGHGAQLG